MSCYVPKGQEGAINYESKFVKKSEINKVPTLERQAPNRKGNQSMKPANQFNGRMATGGVTNTSPNTVRIAQPKGAQGMPSVGKPLYNTTIGRGDGSNKANAKPVDRPKDNYKPTNLAFIKNNHIKFGG
jgi:hypothetical protein